MPRVVTKKVRSLEAQKMIRLRSALDFTQRELAKHFNVSAGAIAHWELGNRTIPGAVLKLMEIYEKKSK
jgi:DNA-binding transcriptional regulator YiaG